MNYSTAVFLISDEARAIHVTYEKGDDASRTIVKTMNSKIKVDDYVVVETDTRHGMTVCKVVDVDIDVDFDSTEQIKWEIGVVARANFEALQKQEEDAISAIKSAEKRRKKDDLREALVKDHAETLKALPIYTVRDTKPAIETSE